MRRSIWEASSLSISRRMRVRRKRLAMRLMTDMGLLTSCVAQHGADAFHELFEAFFGFFQLIAAGDGEFVKLGLALGLGKSPFGGDPSTLLHAMKGGIERALFNAEKVFRGALDVEHDAVAVEVADAGEGLEDEEIERALKVILCQFVPLANLVWSDDTPSCMGMSSGNREQKAEDREQRERRTEV